MDHWTHPLTWGLLGAMAGAIGNRSTRMLATSSDDTGLYSAGTGALMTAILFGALGWQTSSTENLVLVSCLVVVATPLAVIDMVEMRLPNPLLAAGYLGVGTCAVTAAAAHGEYTWLGRAAVGCAVMIAVYLGLALCTGGLGSGDVRLGGLLGMTSAWVGWPVLVASTILGWVMLLSVFRLGAVERGEEVPAGPSLLGGTLIAVLGSGG
ncbi:prepilin peptidase [Actinokineospora spheciospongiae]|uniref:prepilin peptidase n=1 Tax=Actinokineospora spheciospongiae TaxID=909613 RepID=UPI000D717D0F|nr:prepilin peptidase [Actinokineospora spheciospongiae]PWW53115.1 leader peptidase (prepilin peptidase)/N-methyltransferase [Actinokineospora spheciospongiae]